MKPKTSACVLLVASLAVGCASLATFQAKPSTQAAEREAGKILLQVGLSAAATYAGGGTLDSAWAVPVALNSVSTIVKDLSSNQQAADLVQATITSFVADPKLKSVGKDLANAFLTSHPQTPTQRQDVVIALAKGASSGLSTAQTVTNQP